MTAKSAEGSAPRLTQTVYVRAVSRSGAVTVTVTGFDPSARLTVLDVPTVVPLKSPTTTDEEARRGVAVTVVDDNALSTAAAYVVSSGTEGTEVDTAQRERRQVSSVGRRALLVGVGS